MFHLEAKEKVREETADGSVTLEEVQEASLVVGDAPSNNNKRKTRKKR